MVTLGVRVGEVMDLADMRDDVAGTSNFLAVEVLVPGDGQGGMLSLRWFTGSK